MHRGSCTVVQRCAGWSSLYREAAGVIAGLLLLLMQLSECLRVSCKDLTEAAQATAFVLIKRVCYSLCRQRIVVILDQNLVRVVVPHR